MKRKIAAALTMSMLASTVSVYAADSNTSASKATTTTTTTTTAKPTTASKPTTTVVAKPTVVVAPTVVNDKGYTEYVVVQNDNLSKIAKKYNTTYQEIAKLNNIKNVNLIYPGQTLLIPGTEKVTPVVDPVKPVTPAVDPVKPVTPVTPVVPDAVTSASEKEHNDATTLVNGLSDKGFWINSILNDITVTSPLTVSGEFHSKDDASAAVYRKLALYAQDENRKVTAEYTLTVPEIVVESPNFYIVNGTVDGNITVNAPGFELSNTTVTGDVVFANRDLADSANFQKGNVLGEVKVLDANAADGYTSATPKETSNNNALAYDLSDKGEWIVTTRSDMTLTKDLVIDGEFHSKDDPNAKVYRKFGTYKYNEELDANGKKTRTDYNLTFPNIVVNSPELIITSNGTSVLTGNIQVNAPGFMLTNVTLNGDVEFASQDLRNTAKLGAATINGNINQNAPYVDGTYYAEITPEEYLAANPTKTADDVTWLYNVTIEVKNGSIKTVNWDANNVKTGETKKELSKAGGYVMHTDEAKKAAEAAGKPLEAWDVQAKSVESALVNKQNIDLMPLADDGLHFVDGVSSATVKTNDFVQLVNEAFENGPVK